MFDVPDIQGIIVGLAKGDDVAKADLLDLIDALCEMVEEAELREAQARGDLRVVYRNKLGMFQSPPMWASEAEANWNLLRQMVMRDTKADIGEWPDKKRVERLRQTPSDPALYKEPGHDINYFS